MSEVVTSIDIKAPPEKVWAIAMDPEHLDEWVTIHRGLGDHDGGAARKGFEMDQTLCLRGVNFKVHWELDTCREPHHAEWKGTGPARSRAETEYNLTAIDGGTRFDYRNEFKAPFGPLGAAASRALVGGVPQREATASLRKLKALAEQD
ncbi:MAG: SRPBCC family protein [Actinomycetota bacterium]|nr:SRPBCC family protein [Actinomycetota bacterium]